MRGLRPSSASSGSELLVEPYGGAFSLARRASDEQSIGDTTVQRLGSWIVRSLILATTAFAFLDLYLLLASTRS
jgi:hypothetical protein